MKPKHVLITGGTGFIGSRLAMVCLEHGESVRVFGQANTVAERENIVEIERLGVEVTLGSVESCEDVRDAVQGSDVVYHLAAAQHEAGKPDEHFRNVNVIGTRNLVEASLKAGVGRFVHGSTIGVYSVPNGKAVHDNSPTEPDNIYGVTKLEAESAVAEYAPKLPAVTIRISETYGPGDRRLLKLFKGLQRRKYFHIGRSANLHHPVYVGDVIAALRLAVTADGAIGRTMVVPGYEVVTSRQMVTTIAEVLGVRPPRLTIPLWPMWTAAVVMETTLRPLGISPPLHRRRMHFFTKSFEFSGEQARSVLGYQPKVSFRKGIEETNQWYRKMGLL